MITTVLTLGDGVEARIKPSGAVLLFDANARSFVAMDLAQLEKIVAVTRAQLWAPNTNQNPESQSK